MIRILYILHTLNLAGVERMVFDLIRCNQDVITPAVVCLDCKGPLANELESVGIPIYFTERMPGFDVRQITHLVRIMQDFKPDIIHAHQYTPFFYSAMAHRLSRVGKVIFTEHGRHFPDNTSWRRRFVNRMLLRKTAKITAVCEFTKQALIRNESIPGEKIDVIYNGVEVKKTPNFCGGGKFVIVQVANFRPIKDQKTAIRAMRTLHEKSIECELILIGEGEELVPCKKLVEDLHLVRHVRFPGRCDDVTAILRSADVILNTSLSEAHSLALLEGMAEGLPVIASNVGGNPEIVVDGETGFLFPAGDSDTLAGLLVQLAGDENLRRRMGEAGFRRVQAQFSRSAMHRKYIAMYKQVAEMNHG